MEQQPHLNDHNKQEYPPMHTTEHIINQTMIRLFGCGRSISAHIERKKSKLDYLLAACPTEEEIKKLEEAVNEASASEYMWRIHQKSEPSKSSVTIGTKKPSVGECVLN